MWGILNYILDLIFPVECLSCELSGSYLCAKCLAGIKLSDDQRCLGCGKQTALFGICPSCRPDWAVDGVFAAVDYDQELIHRLVWNLKYNYVEAISGAVAGIIIRFLYQRHLLELLNLKDADLVPVPLYFKRERARGFNQSLSIANALIEGDPRFKLNNCLARNKNTGSQLGHEKHERQRNVRNAFSLRPGVRVGEVVFLIDDVVTTGSTLNEAAAALKDAGVKKVYGLALAKRS